MIVVLCLGAFLAEGGYTVFCLFGIVDHKGNRIDGVGTNADRSGMIGKDHNAVILTRALKVFVNRLKDLLINQFNRQHLVFKLCAVSTFIRTFYVNVNVFVAILERIDRSLRLSIVVGVYVSGCTLHVDGLHACAQTDALDEVNGGDDRTANTPFLGEIRETGLLAGTPQPRRIGRLKTAGTASLINGMMIQHLKALLHETAEFTPTVLLGGQIITDTATDDVMRAGKIVGIVAILPQNAMAIADARHRIMEQNAADDELGVTEDGE